MQNEKSYTVYKHTSPDGKVYIGATSNSLNRRWQNGYGYRENKDFYSDIEYYGWDNFSHDIVASDLTETEAYKLEENLIQQYCTTDPGKGYNKSIGGKGVRGVIPSVETRTKIGDAERGTNSDETKRKIASVHRGTRLTEEHKQKISESIKKKVLCIETNTVYNSLYEAAINTGANACGISSACNGRYETSGGYHWKYYNDQKGDK